MRQFAAVVAPLVATALLLTVIQAPLGWGLLAWVAWVPFYLAALGPARTRRLVWVSYLVGVGYWLANLYWVAYVAAPGYFGLCLYLGLYWPAAILLFRWLRRVVPQVPIFLATTVLIVGAEAAQGLLMTGFNWRFLAHSQWKMLPLIQIADLTGALGVSVLVALVNGLIVELAHNGRREGWRQSLRWSRMVSAVFVLSLLVSAWLYGMHRIAEADEHVRPGPQIGLVQPNIPSFVKEVSENGEEILQELIEAGDACFDAGAELVAWPETIVLASLNPEYLGLVREDSEPRLFDRMIREHARDRGYVLAGAHAMDLRITGQGLDMDVEVVNRYNSAFLYRPDGTQDRRRYDKIYLVPFGEYIPFKYSMPWIYKIILKLSPYDFDYNLTAGDEYTTFDMKAGGDMYHFGSLICYDDTNAQIARRMTVSTDGRKKADWLVNVSNDGWYVRFTDGKVIPSGELSQRTVITAFRAVENRVAVARSVNTGISCVVDTLGRIRDGYEAGTLPTRALAREGVAGWLVDTVPIDDRVTFFSVHGYWLKTGAAALFGLVFAGYCIEMTWKLVRRIFR